MQVKRLKHRCFPVEFMKFLRTYERLFLEHVVSPGVYFLISYTLAQIDTWFLHHNLQFLLPILPSLPILLILLQSEAAVWWCSVKKMFLRILQNLQEKSCARVSLQICRSTEFNFMKKVGSGKCFLVSSTKFLIAPFLENALDGCFCINTLRVFRSSHQRCSM